MSGRSMRLREPCVQAQFVSCLLELLAGGHSLLEAETPET
jgi:hypothetical protein